MIYLYQIYDNGNVLDGYYSIKEATKIINATDSSTTAYYARSGRVYKKRWKIKRFKQDQDGMLEEAEYKGVKRRTKKAEDSSQTGISEEAERRKRRREIKRRLRQLEIDKHGASIWLGYLQFANEFLKGGHRNGRNNGACKEAAE